MISTKLYNIFDNIILSNERSYNYNHKSKFGTHIAVVMNNKYDIITSGVNHVELKKSVHAEIDAVSKLPYKKNKNKNKKRIILFVARLSKTSIIGESRPCWHCLINAYKIALNKGYKIQYIIHSTSNQNLIKKKYIDIVNEPHQHISYHWSKQNYTIGNVC